MCIYVCVCGNVNICMCIYMCVRAWVSVCACVCARVRVCAYSEPFHVSVVVF